MEAREDMVLVEEGEMKEVEGMETGPARPRPAEEMPAEEKPEGEKAEGTGEPLADLAARLAEAERRAGDALAELERVRLEREIDRELLRAGAVDTEAARNALGDVAQASVAAAVAELRRARPALFARREGVRASAASVTRRGAESIEDLAAAARSTGDRRLLLRYLRRRRTAR